MNPLSRVKPGMTVRKLLRERLAETERSPAELAEAVDLPAHYVTELLSGHRRPPLPARTDIYERMTRFLRLSRNDLAACATAERAETAEDAGPPEADVQDQLFGLCDAETAKSLKRRGRTSKVEIVDLLSRLLAVAQGAARRSLDAQIPLRIAATRNGTTYPETRLRVVDFLDACPATLTLAHLSDFVHPHIAAWDVDLDTGILRVTLRSAQATERHRRRPIVRTGRARLAG